MKRNLSVVICILIAFIFTSCKKDNDKDKELNAITITEGELSGYSHTFSPNLGFWSPVDETTRYMHLVLGDDSNQSYGGENVISIVFYDNGAQEVQFPSPEGQWIRFMIIFDDVAYNFAEESAVLAITQMDDMHFEGTLTGQFVDMFDSSIKINFTMYLSLPMQQI